MQYIKTTSGDIYKQTLNPDVYIKVSPWDPEEDRRLPSKTINEMVNNNQASKLNMNKALEELNTIWREAKRHWIHNGRYYKSEGTICNAKGKEKTYSWKNSYHKDWKLCMFQGHIYWYRNTQYNPRVELVLFEGVDVEPTYCKHSRWTNIKNLKPIYKKNNFGNWERI